MIYDLVELMLMLSLVVVLGAVISLAIYAAVDIWRPYRKPPETKFKQQSALSKKYGDRLADISVAFTEGGKRLMCVEYVLHYGWRLYVNETGIPGYSLDCEVVDADGNTRGVLYQDKDIDEVIEEYLEVTA